MRDKLIELINENRACPEEDGYPCEKCVYDTSPSCFVDRLADVLIANGVTFADVPDTNVGKWIPVSERLPKPFISVLVQMPEERPCPTVHEGFLNRNGTWYAAHFERERSEVTHWMPMPQPPKEGE